MTCVPANGARPKRHLANNNSLQMMVDPRSYERNYMQLRKEA